MLSIGTIVIPPAAGVLSAFGLVASDFVRYESRTVRFPIDEDGAADRVRKQFAEMRAGAVAAFAALGMFTADDIRSHLERIERARREPVVTDVELDELDLEDPGLLEERHRQFELVKELLTAPALGTS